MREIKFRGKRTDNGEWVYGWYYEAVNYLDGNTKPMIVWMFQVPSSIDRMIPAFEPIEWEVIPETVGQYTGFKDKNGKEIYDGSIIRVSCTYNSDVGEFFITNIAYDFCWNNGFSAEPIRGYPCITHIAKKDLSNVEIIGNIHDNPELLEKIE